MEFDVVKTKIGKAKLEDGTILTTRVIIADIQEVSILPTGPDLAIAQQTSITANSPAELKSKMHDKPLVPPDNSHNKNLEIWENIDIKEFTIAIEEVQFTASDNKSYKLIIEVEPTIVARTLEYRDQQNNPAYNIRWSNKIAMYLIG